MNSFVVLAIFLIAFGVYCWFPGGGRPFQIAIGVLAFVAGILLLAT